MMNAHFEQTFTATPEISTHTSREVQLQNKVNTDRRPDLRIFSTKFRHRLLSRNILTQMRIVGAAIV